MCLGVALSNQQFPIPEDQTSSDLNRFQEVNWVNWVNSVNWLIEITSKTKRKLLPITSAQLTQLT